MLSATCSNVAAAGQREEGNSVTRRRSSGCGHAPDGEERQHWVGVQEWPDGSRYEGEFVNGLKHGNGKYIWENGEYYEGSFYKDYKHGDAVYSWPTGHKFIGKFYLNRKEGYGQQMFPDGTTFQGLYYLDQRFGPGVLTHPDGRQDVGLWLKERLLRLCTSVEESFSLNNFPDYAAFAETSVSSESVSQHKSFYTTHPNKTERHFKVVIDGAPLSDESLIYPPGIESYSTDGDHLPLPPGRRKELDQHFFGEQWEPETEPQRGYERNPLCSLPLQARMEAHIHKHRLQAETVGWDVAAVLSLKREGFGPKGPWEVASERLIQQSSQGDLEAASQIIQTGLIHPDVADSKGHTALFAATVNCHNDVIHMLLDRGADIDKLNSEGLSALAACHVLYYPFQSLYTALVEPPTETPDCQVSMSPSSCGNVSPTKGMDFTTTSDINDRSQTPDVVVSEQANIIHLPIQCNVSNHSELITEFWHCSSEPETTADTVEPQEDEKKDKDGGHEDCVDTVKVEEEQYIKEDEDQNQCDESRTDGRECETIEKPVNVTFESKEMESRIENMAGKEKFEEDLKESKERREHSPEGLKCQNAVSSDQWTETEVQDKELTPSYIDNVHVTEEVMKEEALCCTGIPSNAQEAVHNVAAMKIKPSVRLKTMKLLMERGSDPNLAQIPMPVLFLAIMAADAEAVKTLVLCGTRTDIPLPAEKKGLYPLHVAAALPGPAGVRITELLLHTAIDADVQACDQNEVCMRNKDTLSLNETPRCKEGGQTALHIACQRDSDHQNASKVVSLLLSHRASTDLLWSGHTPLSLAIASGNDLAVEELLTGGADPNIPLSDRVGSALCVLTNIKYNLDGNKTKMLDMLIKAGADISMPVTVGNVVGTAVDYAHYSFSRDRASFLSLNKQQRQVHLQLLRMMGDQLRQSAGQREKQHPDILKGAEDISSNGALPSYDKIQEKTEKERKPAFQFCYQCGRSAFVKLTACSSCKKVFFCSWTCKNKAQKKHNEECMHVSGNRAISFQKLKPSKSKQNKSPNLVTKASADGIQKSVMSNSTMNPKDLPPKLSVSLKFKGPLKSASMAEKQNGVSLRENYSCN